MGKTAFIADFARAQGLPLHTLLLSAESADSVLGIPFRSGEGVTYSLPEWAQAVLSGPCVLFLDELTCAPPHLQGPMLTLIACRRLHGRPLHKGVIIVAAANPPEFTAEGYDLSPAFSNRFAHVHWEVDASQWADNFPLYWGSTPDGESQAFRDERALVAAYVRRNPGDLLRHTAGASAWPSPRSWELYCRLVSGGQNPAEALYATVGEGCGGYLTFRRHRESIPDPANILKAPDKTPVPEQIDAALVAIAALTSVVKDAKQAEAAYAYLGRISDVHGGDLIMSARPLLRAYPPKRGSNVYERLEAALQETL